MKKILDIVAALCALGAAVLFAVMAGPQFLKLQGGAEELGQRGFGEAEGKYVSYQAAYPVASQVEEYYSGDPDRARESGYVIYDDVRREFLYVVISKNDDRDLDSLMGKLDAVSEMREGRDMSPVSVKGTLSAVDEADAKQIARLLEESGIVDRYGGIEGQEEYFEKYYGDEYGKIMTRMSQELAQNGGQADWYVLENKKIDGLPIYEIWIAILAAGVSFVIFIGKVIILIRGDKKKAGKTLPESAALWERFIEAQREWVADWCAYNRNKAGRQIYLTVAGSVAVLVVIGFLAKATPQQIMNLHVPCGVLFGEGIALLFWLTMGSRIKPDKLLKSIEKTLNKELSSGDRERFAEDILEAGQEWVFQEWRKDSLIRGILGSRYWVFFLGGAMATVVDSDRIGELKTEDVTERVRNGKARLHFQYYVVRFIDRDAAAKKNCSRELSFQTQDGRGDFMILARRRKGDEIKIS